MRVSVPPACTCMHCGRHSLPVGDVGLVVPVLPALQRVDIGVHSGLATGHRPRHGDTRDPGAGPPSSAGLAGGGPEPPGGLSRGSGTRRGPETPVGGPAVLSGAAAVATPELRGGGGGYRAEAARRGWGGIGLLGVETKQTPKWSTLTLLRLRGPWEHPPGRAGGLPVLAAAQPG